MAYVAPTVRSVGDAVTAADYNIMANDVINLRGLANVVQASATSGFGVTYTHPTPIAFTGLAVNITPTTNTSKVLVHVSLGMVGASVDVALGIILNRDSTPVGVGDAAGSRLRVTSRLYPGGGLMTGTSTAFPFSFSFLDSPATTSAISYNVTMVMSGSGTIYCNRSNADGNDNSQQRAASFIIVQEIPA